ncbi:Myb-like_DNA-binding domain-containing protein [Hexamita inflata]|uniref:Myb-like DNA-binding domain-containing protein n=1 Tax=Hexamita inflata TaxID=28002 RepID=A0AA86PQR8_9EUKA|nr:Myb-like DNA-binding domain-containing protein [Hexamita inflata]
MSYTKWDQADEFKLKAAVDKYGNNWNMIHKHVFPERGAICLKNKAFEVAPDNISSGQNKSEQLNQNDLDLLTQVRAFMLSQERQ